METLAQHQFSGIFVSLKKSVLKISQNSQKSTCARVFFDKAAEHLRSTVSIFFLRLYVPIYSNAFQYSVFQILLADAVARRCSVKKVLLKNFGKFTGKHLCQSLFFNEYLLKKRLWHRYFLMNFLKFLRTPFLQNTSSACFYNGKHRNKREHCYKTDYIILLLILLFFSKSLVSVAKQHYC